MIMDMKEKRYNLLFLSIIPIWGGATKNLLELLKRLDKNIFNPILILPDNRGLLYSEALKHGIEVRLVRMPFLQVSYNPFKLFIFMIKILQINIIFFSLIKKLNIEMVICNTIQDSLFISLPSRVLNKKLIIYIKNIFDRKWKKIFISKVFDLFADKIIAVSNKVKTDIVKYMKNVDKTTVIHEGIDIDNFKKNLTKRDIYQKYHNLDEKCFRIINIGNIAELKGQKLLLEALSRKEFKDINFKVFFIGEANFKRDLSYKKTIEEFIKNNSLADKVFFPGFKKNINDYINHSDLLVHCPVLEEGFGLVILEAFCLEKVVVATNVGGIPEIIEDSVNGFLCRIDKEDLANKILYVYNNQNKLGYIKDNAIKTVKEKFTLENQIKNTEKIYYDLLGLKYKGCCN
ncbi:MAG: glycosyltransferase family 1 protein [Candidatus Atribacteria bacterium]|nr:MAG: glycosyltransferase family 1 protein [Candidatus Atribacteria bacterium]